MVVVWIHAILAGPAVRLSLLAIQPLYIQRELTDRHVNSLLKALWYKSQSHQSSNQPACAKYLELSLWYLPLPEKNITRLLYCQQVTKAKAHGRESDTHINRTPLSKTTRTETEYFLFSFLYVHGNVAYSYQVWIHGINRCLQFSCSSIRLCETGPWEVSLRDICRFYAKRRNIYEAGVYLGVMSGEVDWNILLTHVMSSASQLAAVHFSPSSCHVIFLTHGRGQGSMDAEG